MNAHQYSQSLSIRMVRVIGMWNYLLDQHHALTLRVFQPQSSKINGYQWGLQRSPSLSSLSVSSALCVWEFFVTILTDPGTWPTILHNSETDKYFCSPPSQGYQFSVTHLRVREHGGIRRVERGQPFCNKILRQSTETTVYWVHFGPSFLGLIAELESCNWCHNSPSLQ